MFDEFLCFFNQERIIIQIGDPYENFLNQLGGKVFGKGLFNSFSSDNVKKWTDIVAETYPEFKDKFRLFGYDWLGRCFGIDLRNKAKNGILMFEIGTSAILEIPCSFEGFLNKEIPLYSDACLAEPFFHEWLKYSKTEIKYGRCVGYKIPLFLGGKDTVDNLEDSDMEVYWSVIGQIKNNFKS